MDPRVFLFALATFVTGTAENIIVGLVLDVASDLRVSVALAGQLTAVFSLSFALMAPCVPLLGHRLRPRPLYLSALALFVFGNVLAALSPSFTLLFLARVMMACASAVVCVLATTLATELVSPSLRGRAIGLIFMGISGSLVLGVPAGMLLGQWGGWRSVFGVLAAVASLVLLLSWRHLPSTKPRNSQQLSYRRHLANGRLLAAQGVSILMIAGHFALFAYLLPYLLHVAAVPPDWAAYAFGVMGLAGVFGGYLGGRLADRMPAPLALNLVPALYLGSLVSLPFLLNHLPWLGSFMVLIWCCISWMISPVVQSFLIRTDSESAQAGISLNFSAMHMGVGAGTAAGGFVLTRFSVLSLPLVAAFLAALAVLLAIIAARPSHRN
ncbi:MFS transporter [Alcaligenes nematophilus]|uniref:MFS transporter n=1 Tax=Alcaligenes nematophilus TaxID=2994643 RepID=UPI00246791EC|nr:MFS transporter [Alcaligenes nematophilus]MDH4866609.1 MFS transporter [Bacillus cereus]MDY7127909.1 MFS transporter [Alcaligenes nematophilus]